ncbi:protease [Mucilaginibacter conchicola]|uniref:Protease n=2 Tax=Mucilaginibacter conchicola TaxID=2303333 RepID=A0A372NN32_9SPHI|nr:protease [Mucilaginibacter conchicola]
MQVPGKIKVGDTIPLKFTVLNRTAMTRKFLKWQTPFEPLLSKYLDIQNELGEEVQYKGPMAKRVMPPPADAYISLKPNDSLVVKVNVLKGYDIHEPGKYKISYTSENVSGLKVLDSVNFEYR